jgi:site-specific DNA-methyltransferase (adenine-specific)
MQKIRVLSNDEKRNVILDYIRTAPELSDRQIAKALGGISPTTVGKYRKELIEKGILSAQNGQSADYDWRLHPYLQEHPEIITGLTPRQLRAIRKPGVLDVMHEKRSKNPTYCQTILNTRCKEARKSPQIKLSEKDVLVFQHDIRNELYDDVTRKPLVKDDSIDLLLVDPMYDRRSVQSIYPHISSIAGRCLKPSGILLVMIGQAHLPEALTALLADNRLQYHWTICYSVSGKNPSGPMQWKKVVSAWKPIIVISKGSYNKDLVPDTITAPPDVSDKEEYAFGQSVPALQELIERYTDSGDTVMDVCCGGGSCAEAAILSNRRFVGCDISSDAVRITKAKVARFFGA